MDNYDYSCLCFSCKYQGIRETSHEWLENFCQKKNITVDPCGGCELYEANETPVEEDA